MLIDLRSLPSYYINLDSQPERGESTKQTLSSLEFSSINRYRGEIHPDPKIGCAMSHHKLMSDINVPTPFILFEDDIVYTGNNKFIYDIPDDADALYIGCSQWARFLNFSGPYLQYRDVSEDIVQIYNMLAVHAVVFLNQGYREHLSRIAQHGATKHQYHMDIGYAETQRYYNVYALNRPIFKQSGYNDSVTSTPIREMGMSYDESKKYFNEVIWDLNKLVGKPDLKGSPGYYDPRWWGPHA